jgi:hypothetical protein
MKPLGSTLLSIAHARVCLVVAVALGLLAYASPAAAASVPTTLWQVPAGEPYAGGRGAGEIFNPRAVAADPSSGDVFVGDSSNHRIDEFTAWGVFVKAFGWKVNAQAPVEELQVCTAETGCQGGTLGSGTGQFQDETGLAVGADGRIYVAENESYRVQAFEPNGDFSVMFGREVNKTKTEASAPEAERNRCPVDPTDVCQAGVSGTGPGEFSNSDGASSDYIAGGPGGSIYVGDVGRIEKFDADGNFTGEIAGPALTGKTVRALDVDGAGNSYVTTFADSGFEASPTVLKLGPGGEELASFDVPEASFNPRYKRTLNAVALATNGNLYAVSDAHEVFGATWSEPRIIEFGPVGNVLIPTEAEEEAEEERGEESIPPEPFLFGQVYNFNASSLSYVISGLATSSACGIEGEDLYAAYTSFPNSLLRAYGPHPDPSVCPPPPVAPSIEDTFATSVNTDGATVQAKINPHFWGGTTYYVQYGTGKCSEGGCGEEQPNPPGSELGSQGGVGVNAPAVFLGSLIPGTTYHYRFVAQSSGGGPTLGPEASFTTAEPALPLKADCPNQAFRVGRAAPLPECRAYELVSPLDKQGADILALVPPVEGIFARIDQSSVSGDRFTYSAYRPFGQVSSSPYSSQYLASRDPGGGWSNAGISPPRGRPLLSATYSDDAEYKAFSPDLCNGWLRFEFEPDPPLDPNEIDGYMNLYRKDLCGGGGYEALTTVSPPHSPKVQSYLPEIQGYSGDGRCTVFRSNDSLTPEAPYLGELKFVLYEDCGGTLRLVAILPDGTPAATPSTAGVGNLGQEENYGYQHRSAGVFSAISEDGSRIYWTTPGTGAGKLYLRINADKPQSAMSEGSCSEPEMACTLPVSEKASSGNARFWAASADGTHAIFSIPQDGEKENLYEYDVSNPLKPRAKLIAKGVTGVMGASEDVSRVYFASKSVLAPGASAGQPNLYFFERGGSSRFIATLAQIDASTVLSNYSAAIEDIPSRRNSRVTADGLHAVFISAAPLTGFANIDQASAKPDLEVFAYDASAEGGRGRLVCVSCDPSGTRPRGREVDPGLEVWAAARIPAWEMDMHGSSVISEDGSRVFFDSYTPLVQRDTNGREDVYEWHSAESKQACEEIGAERYAPDSHGCLSLISSGDSSKDSEFLEASPDGEDVFFATDASLLAQDPGLIDVYDARVDGGFPPPPGPPAACEGEACQKAPPPPNDPTPASASFKGEGNAKPAPAGRKHCPKGRRKVTKRGKAHCVKRRHARHAHHKRSRRHGNPDRRSHR